MNKRLLTTTFSFLCIAAGTIVAIQFAKGYRPTSQGTVKSTGLLAANSFPNGASVYINGNLTTATDTTLNLEPGTYDIEIKKDGYSTWKKKLHLEKELVSQTNAMLFPTAPSLTPLTFTGANNITPSPDGEQLLFTTASASAAKNNGIYVLSLSDSPISLQRGAFQIAKTSTPEALSQSTMIWSPDFSQVMLIQEKRTYLLPTNRTTDLDTATDVTTKRTQTLLEWKETSEKKRQAALELFPGEFVALVTQSAKNLYISPDQERIVYTATSSATLPDRLIAAVPAANTQEQERVLTPGTTYVYDRHEDRNFAIEREIAVATPSPKPATKATPKPKNTAIVPIAQPTSEEVLAQLIESLRTPTSPLFAHAPQWLSDSKHLVLVTKAGVDIVEYDGTNRVQVYAGPFVEHFAYPWPNGSKLLILTNFNQAEAGMVNLYALGLK